MRCTRNNGHDIHGHSSQQNTLRRTPSTAREARSERPRPATTVPTGNWVYLAL